MPNDTVRPDNAEVDLQAEFEASNIDEVLDKLDRELIGLKPVKTRIREIAALLLVERLRRRIRPRPRARRRCT